jgi:phage terminase small subunit
MPEGGLAEVESGALIMQEADTLTPKQRRFVEEYIIDLNGAQAAIRAGYAPNSARQEAHRLLTNAYIEAAISELIRARSERTRITADRVVEELAALGFANIIDFMRIGDDGDPYVDMSNLTRAQAAALQEFVVEDFKDGRGEDARDVRRIRIKMRDKLRPLVELGKHLGMFKARELTVVQATNDTLHVDTLADLAERYENAPFPPRPPSDKVP